MTISELLATKEFMKPKLQKGNYLKYIYKHGHNNSKYTIQRTEKGEKHYYGIYDTIEQALDMRNKLIENGWDKSICPFRQKQFKNNLDTRYTYRTASGKYGIHKNINDKIIHFGTYDSLDEARAMRDKLIANNWDRNIINIKKYNQTTYSTKYIQKTIRADGNVSYEIYKHINGKKNTFGTFRSRSDAIAQRELLIKCNWDEELACEYCGEM